MPLIATAATVVETVSSLSQFKDKIGNIISKIGFTNDNGIIAARDKMLNFMRQASKRDISDALLRKYKLTHSDIDNVGSSSYYKGVSKRLAEFGADYITNNKKDIEKLTGVTVDVPTALTRFSTYMKDGKNIDHAFWLTLAYKKDPFTISPGSVVPIKDYTMNTPDIQPISKPVTGLESAMASFTGSNISIMVLMVVGVLVLYFIFKNK